MINEDGLNLCHECSEKSWRPRTNPFSKEYIPYKRVNEEENVTSKKSQNEDELREIDFIDKAFEEAAA